MDKLNKNSSNEELFDDTIKVFCELSRYSYPDPIIYEVTDASQFTIEGIRNLGCNLKFTVNNNENIEFFASNESEKLINNILNIIMDANNISRRRAVELLKEFFIRKLNKYKNKSTL